MKRISKKSVADKTFIHDSASQEVTIHSSSSMAKEETDWKERAHEYSSRQTHFTLLTGTMALIRWVRGGNTEHECGKDLASEHSIIHWANPFCCMLDTGSSAAHLEMVTPEFTVTALDSISHSILLMGISFSTFFIPIWNIPVPNARVYPYRIASTRPTTLPAQAPLQTTWPEQVVLFLAFSH